MKARTLPLLHRNPPGQIAGRTPAASTMHDTWVPSGPTVAPLIAAKRLPAPRFAAAAFGFSSLAAGRARGRGHLPAAPLRAHCRAASPTDRFAPPPQHALAALSSAPPRFH